MPARKPTPTIQIATWEEADEHLELLGTTTRKREALDRTLDGRLARVRKAIAARKTGLLALEKAIPDALKSFCTAHRDDFGASKTKELTHGTLRFYFASPSVALLAKKWSFERAFEALRDVGRRLLNAVGIWPRDKAEAVHLVNVADAIEQGVCLGLANPIVQTLLRNGRWIRIVAEFDKEQMLADYRDKKVGDAELAEIGIRIEQPEHFAAEPKSEEA